MTVECPYTLQWDTPFPLKIAPSHVQNRYILLPLLGLTLPTDGFRWDDLHKIF